MEAIGAGASVLAFVTLGLKSVKIIHEIVASVKDGKVFLEQTRQDIQGLQATLEKLRDCRAIVDRNDHQLADKIKSCAEEMKGIAEKLQALTINGSEPALGRQWKKVKIFLKEKDLERIATTAVKHTTALTLYLQTISSDVLLEVKDELSIARQTQSSTYRSVQDTHSIVAAQQTTIAAAVNTIVVDQAHAIQETMREELGILRQEQSAIASQQTVVTQAIKEVAPKFTDQTEAISNVINAALSQFAAGLDTQMATTIDRVLGQLLPRLSVEQSKDEIPDLKDDTISINEASPTDTMTHAELENSINSLVDTLRGNQGIILLEHASSITKVFFTFLQAVVDQVSLDNSPWFMSRYETWCETCTNHDLAELRRDLTAFQGVLLSSRSVSVNAPSKKASEQGYLFQNRTCNRSYDLISGTLSVTSSSLYSRKRHHGQIVFSSGSHDTEFTQKDVRIRFHPKPGSTPRAVQANIRQLHGSHGTWNSIPRFSVHNILPETSRIFRVVQWGEVGELQELLQLGEASLWDQDEHGRSLLFYGNEKPEMCRFLLQNGADVDHVALPRLSKRSFMTTALDQPSSRVNTAIEELNPLLECQKLLLQAGCDPSWIEPGVPDSRNAWKHPLVEVFAAGIPAVMRVSFDYSDGLITPNVIIHTFTGYTPFLSYCAGDAPNLWYTIETFSFLHSRGANFLSRDNQGNTCLHLCMYSIKSSFSLWIRGGGDRANDTMEYLQQVRHSLVYLIQHGAEVSAINNRGLSVSDIAYQDNVRGHLWDIILADCGLDIATFRTAKYTWRPCWVQRTKWRAMAELYTKEDFMALWKGNEHLCPYYDEVIRTGFDGQLYMDIESDSDEDDGDDSDGDSSDEAQHDCERGSGDGNGVAGDNRNYYHESDIGSNDGSDDDGGCMLEGA